MQSLIEENRRLRAMISNAGSPASNTSPFSLQMLSTDDMINHPQKLMSLVFPSQFISSVQTWNDIFLPTRSQSAQLIQHSKLWTSWIHCAVYYPEFYLAHDELWDHLDAGGTLQQRDPSWLAIYFGLLAVSLTHRYFARFLFSLGYRLQYLRVMTKLWAQQYCRTVCPSLSSFMALTGQADESLLRRSEIADA